MQVGIFPGHMAKICPHTSTGRADYFGPAVNRAARLLCAAKGGQVLVSLSFTAVCHLSASLCWGERVQASKDLDAAFSETVSHAPCSAH